MSSDSARSPVAGVFWLIGERVLLLWGQGADGAFQHAKQLDFRVGNISVTAFQMAPDFNVLTLVGSRRQVSALEEFASAAGLSVGDQASLIAAVFGTVAPMFRLLDDERFKALTALFFATPGLAKGHAHVDAVSGINTAIVTVPARARIAEGDIIVSQGETLGIGRVRSVAGFLARDNDGQRLAAIDFSTPPVEGPSLAVTARGLALLDLVVERHEDIGAFRKLHASSSPDRVSLLHSADDDAAMELDVLTRRNAGSASISEPVLGLRFHISAFASMPHGLFVAGWFHDPDGLVETMTAIDHSLADATVSDRWMLHSGQTGAKDARVQVTGFAAFLPRREEERAPSSVRFRVGLANGENHFVDAPRSAQDLLSQRKTILNAVAGHAFDLDVLRNIYQPALAPLQHALNSRQFVRETFEYGPKSSRKISVVIPLYRETGFIRSQLIAFDVDPFVRASCEIVYVIDDPLIALRVRNTLSGSVHVHRLDIKLVVLGRNGGYALANNFGVDAADGETIVLMNSDVIPEGNGWLEPLVDRLATLPARSVIGPKLIYADESLQHAGMYFFRLETSHWQNMHYFKGYGRALPAADKEREVPAVTGALMILRKADYLAADGFTSDYVVGDYEDSDLCLKLRAMGGTCLYMPDVALFHFERQSMQDSTVERDLGSTIYNRALHTDRWNDTIEVLMARFDEVDDAI
ncbi:glycosyltransferase family 2 protein [Rhizobium sp. TH2]|uniref:glycosyltransferase family 2 protein n=1 Tax=Rhizobium sp. TH2 TaxID=2775403 RepID=UPI002158583D|nr:glycosyltransferase [Rhizobium sp. TH2]UVC08140.1 glycosyltransferase family 2 protein [Rhizobium sp. TH2]